MADINLTSITFPGLSDRYVIPQVDNTLTQAGRPADAKKTGDEISDLKEDLDSFPDTDTLAGIAEPAESDATADLYICDSSGNVLAKFEDGHIKTLNFDSSDIDFDSPIKESSSTEADLYIVDSFGNVIAEFLDGHVKTKNFDSADMVGIPDNVTTLLSDVATLQETTSGIVYRNQDVTDGVYACCNNRYYSSYKQFCMLISGDIHADADRLVNMIEYLNAIDAFDCGVMLGDICGNVPTDDATFYTEAISATEKPFLTVVGNHDADGATSVSAVYNNIISPNVQYAELDTEPDGVCYYYKDFADYSVRVIILYQYDNLTSNLCYGETQLNWLISTLNSTPDGYGVIICEHTNPSRYMTYNMDSSVTSATWRQSNYAPTAMSGDPVPDIVNAWINGTTLSQTYTYTDDSSTVTISADFTSRGTGEFITYLGGHWHMSVLGYPTDYTDQMDFHVDCSSLDSATQGDVPRKAGTKSEDCFAALAVDRDNKLVKVFYVGAHYTKNAVNRQYFSYSYGS